MRFLLRFNVYLVSVFGSMEQVYLFLALAPPKKKKCKKRVFLDTKKKAYHTHSSRTHMAGKTKQRRKKTAKTGKYKTTIRNFTKSEENKELREGSPTNISSSAITG